MATTTYGLLSTGFKLKPLAQILSDMQATQLAGISTALNLQAPDPIAVITGDVAEAISELWQLVAALYNGMDPDQATGDQLESLSLLTGTDRLKPTATQVLACTVNVNAGFSAAPGTMIASINGNPGALFTNKATVANTGGVAANVSADFAAVNTGPQQCLASTLTVIASPLSGWNSITNPTDGVIGTNTETDAALRTRRSQELQSAGSSTAAAIKSAVLAASQAGKFSSSVTSCTVYFNDTDLVDANGLPPHSIEVVCYQPGNTAADDQALSDLIMAQKGAGIGTWGTSNKTSTDSQGFSEIIYFTRPVTVPIYVAITVLHDSSFPSDGATEIQTALANYGNGVGVGQTIYWRHVQSHAFDVVGVDDVTAFAIGTAPSPGSAANIALTFRQIGTFSTSNIAVTVT